MMHQAVRPRRASPTQPRSGSGRGLIYGTALWVFTLAFATTVGVSDSLGDERYVRQVVGKTVEYGALVEAFISLYAFPLPHRS